MKRHLVDKKGFTLVELMIVIVIMAILVAVAVPVYSAVTKNAEEKSCHSNQEIIVKGVQQCVLNHEEEGAAVVFATSAQSVDIKSQEDAEKYFTAEYLACFEGGKFPLCETDGNYIHVEISDQGKSVRVNCVNDSDADEAHGSWKNY